MVTFQSEKISEHLTRIHGITGELMYLAEGTGKAALIDTGSGVGNIVYKKECGKRRFDPVVLQIQIRGLLCHGRSLTRQPPFWL